MSQSDLITFAYGVVKRPFIWGETDCASLVRKGLGMRFNIDVWPHGGWYEDKESALRFAAKTHGTAQVLVDLGFTRHNILNGQSGDVIIEPVPRSDWLPYCGILLSSHMYLSSLEDGGPNVFAISQAKGAAYLLRKPNE